MPEPAPHDRLHGITLEMMLNQLLERYGWEAMGKTFDMRCFNNDPSVKSCLKFLRKTPWARAKVEAFYLRVSRPGVQPQELS